MKVQKLLTIAISPFIILNSTISWLNKSDNDDYGFKNADATYSIIAGDDLDFSSIYFVDDKGDSHEVYASPKINTYKTGIYEVTLMSKSDPENHTMKVTVHIADMPCEVKLIDGYYDENSDQCTFKNSTTLFWSTGNYRTECKSRDVWDIAKSLEGIGGNCQSVMFRFYNYLYGKQVNYLEPEWIRYEEALPGDLIFYQNGGRGSSHVAVYLGDGLALQGNWLGSARIESIYLPNATQPIFAHPNITFAE